MNSLPFRNFEIFVEIDIFSNLMNVFKFTNKSMGSVVPTLKNFKLVDTSGKRFQKCSEKWWQNWHQFDIITLALFLPVMSSTMVMHISKRKSGKYSRIFWKKELRKVFKLSPQWGWPITAAHLSTNQRSIWKVKYPLFNLYLEHLLPMFLLESKTFHSMVHFKSNWKIYVAKSRLYPQLFRISPNHQKLISEWQKLLSLLIIRWFRKI